MLEKLKIDSFKLRIPRVLVKFIDPKFASKYQKVYTNTGEIDEHINLDQNKVNIENGITTRIGVVHSMDAEGGSEYVVFQLNSKQLKHRYFEGINRQTIKIIYNYIMDFKIVFVEYDTFLNGLPSDIDYCLDFSVSLESMQETNQRIYEKILPYCYKYVSKPFRKKTNTGLQFNDRAKATPSKPYCKIYHKSTELKHNSEQFANEYLKNVDFENIGRFEYTIKDSKHKRYLKLNFKTLDDLLKIPQKRIEQFFFTGIKNYTMAQEIMKDYKDISPTDRMILELINRLINRGSDKHNIYTVLNIYEIPQEKSRMKKKLFDLLEKVDDKDRLISNQESMQMLRVLRLDI
jgi:hypothetical protein